ncbi:MAG: hypothetical protein AAF399_06675 [Bacteroidota bacterium]
MIGRTSVFQAEEMPLHSKKVIVRLRKSSCLPNQHQIPPAVGMTVNDWMYLGLPG